MGKKIKVSTSTNICNHILWNVEHYSSEQAIREIAKAGYDAIDLDCAFWGLSTDPIAADDWKEWAILQKATADELGLPITSGHAHFYSSEHCELLPAEEHEARSKMIIRDIEVAGICNIEWLVMHPESYCDGVYYSRKLSMEKNLEKFKRYGELAAKHGVGIAIENMFIRKMPCFAASSDDLMELLDRLGDDKLFGVCWDTGHANLNKVDQVQAIRQIGKRLKTLHVNDNKGERDEHVLPFHGTIQWEPFMKVLKEVGYTGDFNYEIHNYSKGFDEGFHQEAMRFARQLGEYLVKKYMED